MILYEGPSELDGAPIVVLAPEGRSRNAKTGAMLQTYILRSDVAPHDAVRSGADSSICGDCPHRGDVLRAGTPGKGRTCYVNVPQGPLAAWKAYKRGRHAMVDAEGAGYKRTVRLGTYGDPAAVPAEVWNALLWGSVGHTGYTHQWRSRPDLARWCMASVDSVAEADEAHAMGWRTFRVARPSDTLRLANEARCPASAEMGRKLECAQCLACDGMPSGCKRSSIVIQAHGGFAVMANIRRTSELARISATTL